MATDNEVFRRDVSTGKAQGSNVTIDDNGSINIPTGETYDINGSPHTHAGGGGLTSSATTLTPTTANDTATVTDDINYHFADVSGMTADRSFVVPAGTAKKEIILNITTGDDTYEYVIIGDTGITINGGSAATEWSRLFITGESIRLVATSTSNWQVVDDGRIRCHGRMTLSADDTTNTAVPNEHLPTWDNADINVGNVCDLANYRFNVRRAGNYEISGQYRSYGSVTAGQYVYLSFYVNSVLQNQPIERAAATGTGHRVGAPTFSVVCAVGDPVEYKYTSQAANMGISASAKISFFEIREV